MRKNDGRRSPVRGIASFRPQFGYWVYGGRGVGGGHVFEDNRGVRVVSNVLEPRPGELKFMLSIAPKRHEFVSDKAAKQVLEEFGATHFKEDTADQDNTRKYWWRTSRERLQFGG